MPTWNYTPTTSPSSPLEEFFSFIEQFPNIKSQFANAHAVRDWVRAGRIQYTSKQVVGDRWALLGHAAGFIDPLYSKGLYGSLTAVSLLAHLLLQAQHTGNYSRQAFLDLETVTGNFIRTADRLTANSYKSFKNYKLWQVYAVQWLLGAYTELVRLNMIRAIAGADREAYMQRLVHLKLAGGGYPEFDEIANQVDRLMEAVDPGDETAVAQTVAQINGIYANILWVATPFRDLLKGKSYLPKSKVRLELLKPGEGFMGKGAYRQHFFEELTLMDLIRYGLREKIRFSAPVLARQHKKAFKQQGSR